MTDFRINVIIDPSQAVSGTRKVSDELRQAEGAADRFRKVVYGAFAGLSAGLLIRELKDLTDTYSNLQNRLRTVTADESSLALVTQELFEVSNRTRSSFEGTAEVYARVGAAAKDLGRTQEELLTFTESLNQAVILSGASAQEAQAGLIQLSQGLASGALRGDELRSVLEQLPAVADVIAKSLGVSRGELRKFGEEGKISADIVLDAFKQARTELNERFAKSIPTIGQSFVILKNNLLEYVGAADAASGVSSTLSRTVITLAENVDTLVIALGTLGATYTAVRLAPVAAEALEAARAFVQVRLAVASGNAVLLGSAAAAKLQAAAQVASAAADVDKTAATIASIEAESARALVVTNSTAAAQAQAQAELAASAARLRTAQVTLSLAEVENARLLTSGAALDVLTAAQIQEGALAASRLALTAETNALSLAQAQLAATVEAATLTESAQRATEAQLVALKATLTAQTTALTAAQGRLAAATAATTIQMRILALVNPFTIAIAAAVAFGFALAHVYGELEKVEAQILKTTEAGSKFALTEYGKVGDDIVNVQKQLTRLNAVLANDPSNAEAARQVEILTNRLRDLGVEQDLIRTGAARSAKAAREQVLAIEQLSKAVEFSLGAIQQQNNLLRLNSREREIQSQVLEEIAKLEKESTAKVTDEQRASIENLIRQNQALQDQADAFEDIRGPQQEFESRLEALNVLLAEDRITADEFNKAVLSLAESAKDVDLSGIALSTGEDVQSQLDNLQKLLAAQQEQARLEAFRASVLRDLAGPEAELLERKAILTSLIGNEAVSQTRLAEALAEVNAKLNPLTEDEQRLKDLLESIQGPEREREQRLKDLSVLLATGSITLAEYNAQLERMGELVKVELPLAERIMQLNAQFESGELTEAQYINELQRLEQFQGPSAEFLAGLDSLNQKLADGTITAEQFLAEFNKLGQMAENPVMTFSDGVDDALTRLGERALTTGELVSNTLVSAFDKSAQALADFATTGKLDFKDFARSIIADLLKILAQQLLLKALTGAGIPIPLPGAVGRASGGDFEANQSMIVGEKGPELVRFGAPGTVTPADQTARALAATGTGGSGGTTVNVAPAQVRLQVVNVDSPEAARDAMDTAEGGKIIVNQIRANREAIRRELG